MKRVISFLAIDKSIALNLFGRGWQSIAGLITLWAIGRYLTLVEQGFYFTFLSVLGLQVFFELGLGYVILQFASHEIAHLSWGKSKLLEGDLWRKERLRSFFQYSLIWGAIVFLLIMTIIFPGGRYFFGAQSSAGDIVSWQTPWLLTCFFSSLLALLNIIFCFLEGCGFVGQIAGARVAQNILASLAMWGLLKLDGRLYCLPLMLATSSIVGICFIYFCKREFILDLFLSGARRVFKIDWVKELWPMQWRIALSWISGYVVYQLASPVVFFYQGPKAAGQIGMSMAIGMALMSFSMAWIGAKASKFGMLVAKNNFNELNREFYFATRASLLFIIVIALMVSILNYFAHLAGDKYAERLLAPLPFFLLMMSAVATFFTNALALYIRSHKIEPLVFNSLLGASVSILLLFIFASYFSLTVVVFGYFFVSIIIMLLTIKVYLEKKHDWKQ